MAEAAASLRLKTLPTQCSVKHGLSRRYSSFKYVASKCLSEIGLQRVSSTEDIMFEEAH